MKHNLIIMLMLALGSQVFSQTPPIDPIRVSTNAIQSLDDGDNIEISGLGTGIIEINDSLYVDGSIRATKDLYIARTIVAESETVATGDYILFVDVSNGDTLRRTTSQAIADLADVFTVTNEGSSRLIASTGSGTANALEDVQYNDTYMSISNEERDKLFLNNTNSGAGVIGFTDSDGTLGGIGIRGNKAFTFRSKGTSNGFEVFGIDSSGNVMVYGDVDGRDIASDGSKLDGIESSADVTDEGNVTSALDGASITGVTVATGDKVLIQDVSNSDNLRTVTTQSIADLVDGYTVSNEGGNRVVVSDGSGTGAALSDVTYSSNMFTISNNTFNKLVLNREGTLGNFIEFTNNDGDLGGIGIDANKGLTFRSGGVPLGNEVLHVDSTGNIQVYGNIDVEDTVFIDKAKLEGLAETDTVLSGFSGGMLDTIGVGSGLVLESRTLKVSSDIASVTEDTYSPTLTTTGTNPTVSYTQQSGTWQKVGEWITVNFQLSLGTVTGGTGDYRISLPESSNSFPHVGYCLVRGVDTGFDHYGIFLDLTGSRNLVKILGTSGASDSELDVSTSLSNTFITGSIKYKVN